MGEGKIYYNYFSPTQGSLWISVISRCGIGLVVHVQISKLFEVSSL